jgi:hypothetical protein
MEEQCAATFPHLGGHPLCRSRPGDNPKRRAEPSQVTRASQPEPPCARDVRRARRIGGRLEGGGVGGWSSLVRES